MKMTNQEKKELVEILSIIFQDKEFLSRAHAVNNETLTLTEELLNKLQFCNNATSGLLTAIQCFPKSPNVYGWLAGCVPSIYKVIKMNSVEFKSNMFCAVHGIDAYKMLLKTTL
jgi:hypothetical protein